HEILVEWTNTGAEYPDAETLHGLFTAQARRTPDAIAVRDDVTTLSYAELDRHSDRLAAQLRCAGVGADVLVGVAMSRAPELVVALLAVLKAGGAYLPIDPDYPVARIEFLLQDSGTRLVLTQPAIATALRAPGVRFIALGPSGEPTGTLIDQLVSASGACPAHAESLAYVIYTSGSTGRPKGAMLTHRGVVNYLAWCVAAYDLGSGGGSPVHSSISFDLTVTSLWAPLVAGGAVHLLPDGGGVEALAGALRQRPGYALVKLTPAHLDALRQLLEPGELAGSTRLLVVGGEQLRGESLRWWQQHAPEIAFVNEYGPTETVVGCCVEFVRDGRLIPGAVPIGRPIANTRLYVLDSQMQPVPVGVPGELFIGGAGVARGYLNRPELTTERFVADPFTAQPGSRLYRTGDRARWRGDGTLEYLGRVDDQVKLRGYRVELGEIEHALSRHPAVLDATVAVHDDVGGDRQLVGYVVPAANAAETDPGAGDETVGRWHAVFDEIFGDEGRSSGESPESGFNIAGWDSSYDQRPIPAAEMREWVEQTCTRILDLAPRRVLEIGCGTGLLLFRVAPHCAEYLGLDFSGAALAAIERDPARAALSGVSLRQARAHELGDLPAAYFDTVVINSVIQYFPNVEYLLDVLEQATRVVAPGGAIFIGDVRMLPLLETFHTSVALAQVGDPGLTVGQLRGRVAQQLQQDGELVVDPGFFDALTLRSPAIAGCDIRLKRGRAVNELTRFRADVVLRIGPRADQLTAAPPRDIEWPVDIAAALASQPLIVRIRDVPNGRVERDTRALELVTTLDEATTIRAVRSSLDAMPHTGVDPELLALLAPDYDVAFTWAESGRPERFDAVFRLGSTPGPFTVNRPRRDPGRPWREFVHHATPEGFSQALVAEWKAFVGAQLPDYMVPLIYARIDRVPLTLNGKIDRRALRPPTLARSRRAFVAPRTEVESAVLNIWREVLRIDRISVDDGFLELGGHSLQAMRILGRIRRDFGVALTLADVLTGATAADLAQRITASSQEPGDAAIDGPALVPLPRAGYQRARSTGQWAKA
ncbi:MAG: amino acid adenylation domain-containing protein, partial [Gemmatimonadales bacterium]